MKTGSDRPCLDSKADASVIAKEDFGQEGFRSEVLSEEHNHEKQSKNQDGKTSPYDKGRVIC